MSPINTVRGPVDESTLGRTLMHEHVFVMNMEMTANYDDFDEDVRVAAAVEWLETMVGNGVQTIVDLTVLGLGRYIPRVQRVAAQTSAHIVAATGFYTYNDLPVYWHWRPRPATGPDPLTTMFVRDIEVGIGSTGVRAGILKCATDWAGMTPAVERILRAVARAHRETGVPISTHTGQGVGEYGREQQEVFASEGVDLSRVVIGHMSGAPLDLLLSVVDRGSYIGMDHFGVNGFPPFPEDTARLDNVAEMCRRGYAGQIVLSHDASCWHNHTEPANNPDHHFSYIPTVVLPALRERGVTEEQIDTMMVANPIAILAHGAAY